jgi:hypothetical protein
MRIKLFSLLFLFHFIGFTQLVPHAYKSAVDNFPDVYGGKSEWKRFLHDHLVYPAEELKKKIEGTVEIFFIATKEGKAAKAKVTQSVSPAIDYEALRLLSLLDWYPATQWSVAKQMFDPVNMEWSVKINFSLSKYNKWVKERGYKAAAFTDLPSDSTFIVFEKADAPPVFNIPGKTFNEFVYSNYEYPKIATSQGFEGKIMMTFVIEPDGYCTNIRIQHGIAAGCNEEMIRVIGLTKWKPAVKDGKYIRYLMHYTMVLHLQNNFKDNSNGSQRGGGQ